MLEYFVYVLSFFLLNLFLTKWFLNGPDRQKNLPPSPSRLPILGNLHQLGHQPHKDLCSLAQCHGPLMLLHFGSLPVVVASSADVALEIMKTHDAIFSNRLAIGVTDKLLYEGQDISTAPYGEYWRQMRSICVLQLLSNKRVHSFRNIREQEIAIFMKKVNESCLLSLPVNLSEMFASLTNDVICRAALGRKYGQGESGRKFKELLGEFMVLLGSLSVGDFIPWLRWVNLVNGYDARVDRIAKEFDKFLDGIVDEHTKNPSRSSNIKGEDEKDFVDVLLDVPSRSSNIKGDEHTNNPSRSSNIKGEDEKDFVDVLLDVQKDSNTIGFSITRNNIKAIILDMFAAGTDTTYTVLEWAMTELLRHPEVMKKLQNEVRGFGKSEITEPELDKMHYLKAVIKETFRLYPPIPLLVPRKSTQDVKIKGYDIAAGTTVFTNAWAIGRDPATWDQPEEFRPDRFLNSSIDFKGHDFELIPFGAGRRGCPGISFATATIELLLANLVNKFNWALPGGASGENLDMTECPGLTIHRKVPLLAVATPVSFH